MESKRTCPECHLVFEAPLPETGVLACPLCNTVFAPAVPAAAVSAPTAPAASGRQVLRGVLAVGALLLLAGGLVYAYHLMEGLAHRPAAGPAPVSAANVPPPSEPPPIIEVIPVVPQAPPAVTMKRSQPAPQPPERLSIAVPAEPRQPLTLAERVNRAIDDGLAHLRNNYKEYPQYRNYLGLLGLTLLECGVAADDPSVRQIAGWIRSRERDLTQTYELSLAILFLDRLGNPRDRPLIRTYGQRLLYGQLNGGTWTYSCLTDDPQRFRPAVPVVATPTGARRIKNPDRVRLIYLHGDNSNTQFALLGLWVAQRHGVSVRSALLAAERYFRETQQQDGSWPYHPNLRTWRDSMTCAGLMSLAMRYGVIHGQGRDIRSNQRVRVQDYAVQHGLRYLAQSLDKVTLVGDRIIGVEARDPLYFLWSLERMAVIYNLEKIGEREWYPWAAEMLVEMQRPNGGWRGMGEPVGTCFALLILKRSNFAQDLQLAVRERPSRPLGAVSGPIILQGRDALLGSTGKPRPSVAMPGTAGGAAPAKPLGPSIARTPNAGKKSESVIGVPALPSQK